jgi:hypothetical protein
MQAIAARASKPDSRRSQRRHEDMGTTRFVILKMLWIVIASACVIMVALAFSVPISHAKRGARNYQRIFELDNTPSEFRPSVEQYRVACTDAKAFSDAMFKMMEICLIGGGIGVVLALVGIGVTYRVQKRQAEAQQPNPCD